MLTLLAAIDLGPTTDAVLAVVSRLARDLPAHVHLVHVAAPEPDFVGYQPGPPGVRQAVAESLRDERHRLDALVQRLRVDGLDVDGHLLRGVTAETILAEASRAKAAFVVVGSHARNALATALLGSTARELLRSGGIPVIVVPVARGHEAS